MDDYLIERNERRQRLWNRFVWIAMLAIAIPGVVFATRAENRANDVPKPHYTVAQWYRGWDSWKHNFIYPRDGEIFSCAGGGPFTDWFDNGCVAHKYGFPRKFQLFDEDAKPISVERYQHCGFTPDALATEGEVDSTDNSGADCKNFLLTQSS